MKKQNELSNDEKVAFGICISNRGTDRCGRCTDTCDASRNRVGFNETMKELKISHSKNITSKN